MKLISLLSDTHGYLDDSILGHCLKSDEIWHAGDFGTIEVSDKLAAIKPLRGVYGNIDGAELRKAHPNELVFSIEKVKVMMIHIGGYSGHYNSGVKEKLLFNLPQLFISGHSHILKVMRDQKIGNMLHINPGAAGKHGFHKIRTMVQFKIEESRIFDLEVIELGLK